MGRFRPKWMSHRHQKWSSSRWRGPKLANGTSTPRRNVHTLTSATQRARSHLRARQKLMGVDGPTMIMNGRRRPAQTATPRPTKNDVQSSKQPFIFFAHAKQHNAQPSRIAKDTNESARVPEQAIRCRQKWNPTQSQRKKKRYAQRTREQRWWGAKFLMHRTRAHEHPHANQVHAHTHTHARRDVTRRDDRRQNTSATEKGWVDGITKSCDRTRTFTTRYGCRGEREAIEERQVEHRAAHCSTCARTRAHRPITPFDVSADDTRRACRPRKLPPGTHASASRRPHQRE